jgi:hypothetical protein
MSRLIVEPNIRRPDEVFDLLIGLHVGLEAEQSLRAFGRLVLLLSNHIGDEEVIREAVAGAAKAKGPPV